MSREHIARATAAPRLAGQPAPREDPGIRLRDQSNEGPVVHRRTFSFAGRAKVGVGEDAGVSEFELPSNLVQAVEEDDDAGPERREWISALPRIVQDVARRWSLDVGRPFQPGGVTSWVAPARDAAGKHVVLKVSWRHDEALHEAKGLWAWGGRGAVRLFDAMVVGQTSALLLEACEPGARLSQVLPPLQQDGVVAGLLRRLWIQPPAGHPFRPLESMSRRWADEFDKRYAVAGRKLQLDPGLTRAGIELFRSLPGTAQRCVLLGTDVHPENVLAADREPWAVLELAP